MNMPKEFEVLKSKHQKFVLEYMKDRTATAAAIRAGYKDGVRLNHVSWTLLRRKDIQDAIKAIQRLEYESHIATREEALFHLSEQMRGSCADYLKDDGTIDVDRLRKDRIKIKKVKITTSEKGKHYEFELHDSQGAIAKLAQMQGWNSAVKLEIDKLDEFLSTFPEQITLPSERKK